jgi:protocatechuate 3,4-dioxygenase beta subunit
MSKNPSNEQRLDRRQALAWLGSAGVALLASCGDSGSTSGGAGGATSTSTGNAGGWATGGTASMSGDYPDPFTSGLGSACILTCSQTLGPCYGTTLVRKDISDGHDGLPVRLSLLVVDESCKPIEGATVDIWHTAPEGAYSAFAAGSFCNPSDDDLSSKTFFRGVQVTDANGRVDFDTCFPGWYSGRSIHIHFTIRINDEEYVTSQLYFPDTLTDEIVAGQPLYSDRGARDTNNTNDSVISAEAVGDYTVETAKMPDGALQAWKVLVIRSSLATALCTAPGGSGGPGPGPGGP